MLRVELGCYLTGNSIINICNHHHLEVLVLIETGIPPSPPPQTKPHANVEGNVLWLRRERNRVTIAAVLVTVSWCWVGGIVKWGAKTKLYRSHTFRYNVATWLRLLVMAMDWIEVLTDWLGSGHLAVVCCVVCIVFWWDHRPKRAQREPHTLDGWMDGWWLLGPGNNVVNIVIRSREQYQWKIRNDCISKFDLQVFNKNLWL